MFATLTAYKTGLAIVATRLFAQHYASLAPTLIAVDGSTFLKAIFGLILPLTAGVAGIGVLVSFGLMAIHVHNAATYLKTSIFALVGSLIAEGFLTAITAAASSKG